MFSMVNCRSADPPQVLGTGICAKILMPINSVQNKHVFIQNQCYSQKTTKSYVLTHGCFPTWPEWALNMSDGHLVSSCNTMHHLIETVVVSQFFAGYCQFWFLYQCLAWCLSRWMEHHRPMNIKPVHAVARSNGSNFIQFHCFCFCSNSNLFPILQSTVLPGHAYSMGLCTFNTPHRSAGSRVCGVCVSVCARWVVVRFMNTSRVIQRNQRPGRSWLRVRRALSGPLLQNVGK